MFDLITDIIVRVCIITAIFSILSYYVMRKYTATPNRLKVRIPMLFVVFGVVTLINILYVLERYDVMNHT
ncbi:MAG: hypothetical protein ACREA3_09105 [Nitrosotalea sp.]